MDCMLGLVSSLLGPVVLSRDVCVLTLFTEEPQKFHWANWLLIRYTTRSSAARMTIACRINLLDL